MLLPYFTLYEYYLHFRPTVKQKLKKKFCISLFLEAFQRERPLRPNPTGFFYKRWPRKANHTRTAPDRAGKMQMPLFVFPHAAGRSAVRAVFEPHKDQMRQTPILLFSPIKFNTWE